MRLLLLRNAIQVVLRLDRVTQLKPADGEGDLVGIRGEKFLHSRHVIICSTFENSATVMPLITSFSAQKCAKRVNSPRPLRVIPTQFRNQEGHGRGIVLQRPLGARQGAASNASAG